MADEPKNMDNLDKTARQADTDSGADVVLHDAVTLRSLLQSSLRSLHLPVSSLTAYFGQRAGAYFSFMATYTRSLELPTIAAIAAILVRKYNGGKRSQLSRSVTRLCMAVWALALSWTVHRRAGVTLPCMCTPLQAHKVHPTVGGVLASIVGTGTMLSGVAALILASLNCQGYVTSKSSRFAVVPLQRLSLTGGPFDVDHTLKSLVPVVLHSIVMNMVNRYFVAISETLSSWDGTGTSGVIVKRLLFEALDAYMPLWMLAVVRRDRSALADEVLSLFMLDQLRRITVESVLPFVQTPQVKKFVAVVFLRSRQFSVSSKNRIACLREAISSHEAMGLSLHPDAKHTEELDIWEDFDDWLEMLTQFSYIVLFGPEALYVIPIALLSNFVEARSDVFKMCCCVQRPGPEPSAVVAGDVRTWHCSLLIVAFFGAVVNIIGAGQLLVTRRSV